MYGDGGIAGREIYGYRKVIPCCVSDLCLTEELVGAFQTLLGEVKTIVSTLYPHTEVKSAIVADMGAKAWVHPPILVRIFWRRAHPGVQWLGTPDQVLQLLDIYLLNGWEWTGDKLFDTNAGCLPEDLLPPPNTGEDMITQGRGVDGEAVASAI